MSDSKSQKGIYLAKGGRAHGPFTQAEFNQFHDSGEITQYSWIWDEKLNDWRALDPPPPPLDFDSVTESTELSQEPDQEVTSEIIRKQVENSNAFTVSREPAEVSPPKKRPSIKSFKPGEIQAVCHNFVDAVCGEIQEVEEFGAWFIANAQKADSPQFGIDVSVNLNLVHLNKGNSTQVSARIGNIEKQPEGWAYFLEWNELPTVLRK